MQTHFRNRKLAALRAFKGILQESLSYETGISRPTLQKLESGKTKFPSMKTVQSLAQYFKVPVSVFFSDDEAITLL